MNRDFSTWALAACGVWLLALGFYFMVMRPPLLPEGIDWAGGPVLDKHCVGGLPGNRTTPIVVAIVAAAGHPLDLAAALLDLAPGAAPGQGRSAAATLLDSGAALRKILAICAAQGGFTEPTVAAHTRPVLAIGDGQLGDVDNRRLAKIAKLAGAPVSVTAGIDCRLRTGHRIRAGEPLFHVYAQTPGELEYALAHAARHPDIFVIEAMRVAASMLPAVSPASSGDSSIETRPSTPAVASKTGRNRSAAQVFQREFDQRRLAAEVGGGFLGMPAS